MRRRRMSEIGFNEFSTPILTASSPEVRETLVPSRIHQGKFYALTQAPQQYKQLIMASALTVTSKLRLASVMKTRARTAYLVSSINSTLR